MWKNGCDRDKVWNHKTVTLSIANINKPRGPGYLKLNVSILNDKEIMNTATCRATNKASVRRSGILCGWLWNDLPSYLKNKETVDIFKGAVKTYLFKNAFNLKDCWLLISIFCLNDSFFLFCLISYILYAMYYYLVIFRVMNKWMSCDDVSVFVFKFLSVDICLVFTFFFLSIVFILVYCKAYEEMYIIRAISK